MVAELADGFEHDLLGDGAHLDHAHDLVAADGLELAHVADGVGVVAVGVLDVERAGGVGAERDVHLADLGVDVAHRLVDGRRGVLVF